MESLVNKQLNLSKKIIILHKRLTSSWHPLFQKRSAEIQNTNLHVIIFLFVVYLAFDSLRINSCGILPYLLDFHNSVFNNEIVSSEVFHYEKHNTIVEVQKKFMIPIALLSMFSNDFQITLCYC